MEGLLAFGQILTFAAGGIALFGVLKGRKNAPSRGDEPFDRALIEQGIKERSSRLRFFPPPNFVLPAKRREKKCYVDEKGYYRFADSDKLVHRWVMERHIRRRLRRGEVIHHVDGNKANNNIENLYLCTEEEHEKIHRDNLALYGMWHKPRRQRLYRKPIVKA